MTTNGPPPARPTHPLAVLLVEDSDDDADLVTDELRRHGFAPTIWRVQSRAGLEAALAGGTFDIVLSDYSLPGFDGLEALAIVRERGLDLPFIIVSGSMGEDIAVEAMRRGANDYLLKDRLARLGPAVERELRDAETRRERRAAVADRARLIDELTKAVRARDVFLGIAAHELRTPLAALRLHVEALVRSGGRAGGAPEGEPAGEADGAPRGPAPGGKLRERLVSISQQTDRLVGLVESLLDVARLSAGPLELVLGELDLVALVRSVSARLPHGERVEIAAPAPVVGRWDRDRLEAALANVIVNALKYGAPEPVEVRVERAGALALVTVVDRGIGISPEDRERIFERFERAVSARHYGGLGLGLWITRQAVEAHGGRIVVDSEPGRGTRLVLELPLAPATSATT